MPQYIAAYIPKRHTGFKSMAPDKMHKCNCSIVHILYTLFVSATCHGAFKFHRFYSNATLILLLIINYSNTFKHVFTF